MESIYQNQNTFGWILIGSSPILLGGLLYSVWPVRRELVIGQQGVEFFYRDGSVWCPWELFSEEGEPLAVTYSYDTEITLPICAAAVPLVEFRRQGKVQAKGRDVSARHFSFAAIEQVKLLAVYEAYPFELGYLLLFLGKAMTAPSARGQISPAPQEMQTAIIPADPNAISPSPLPAVSIRAAEELPAETAPLSRWATVDADGWIAIPLTRLRFPALCCDCANPAQSWHWHGIGKPIWGLGLLLRFGIGGESVDVSLPYCNSCWKRQRWKHIGSAVVGGLAGMVLGFGIVPKDAFDEPEAVWGLPLVLAVFTLIGTMYFAFVPWTPFKSLYLRDDRTVAFRFRNGNFAGAVLAQGIPITEEAEKSDSFRPGRSD